MSQCVPPWVHPAWDSGLPGLGWLFPCYGSFRLLALQISSQVPSLSSFWDPYNANVSAFNVVPEVSWTVFISLHSFSIFCSVAVISTLLSSRSFICASALVIGLLILLVYYTGFPCSSVSKESACKAGDLGLIPGLGRSPGEGNGNPHQHSCLENPMDRGAW